MARTRSQALRALIAYEQPLEPVLAELRVFGWDSPEELERVSRDDITRMLDRYLSGQLTADELTDWADLLECREDIGFPANEEALLSETIFRLANPNLRGEITRRSVELIRSELCKSQGVV